MTRAFVLASASPRRRDLLAAVGLVPILAPSDVDESPRAGELPMRYALRIAEDKARAYPGPEPVLAADTVVALDGAILGKAESSAAAIETLERLSGRTHTVHTAVVLRVRSPKEDLRSRIVSTEVRFRELTREQIERYVQSGEPMDKAGAYGIQGEGGALVAEVFGSYSNVVGLPLEETLTLLRVAGVIE